MTPTGRPPASRRRRFLSTTLGATAVALAVGCGDDDGDAQGVTESSDLETVRFVLRLERVESAFYEAAIGAGVLGGPALSLARSFHEHEREHIEVLEGLQRQLGGRPEPTPRTDFPLENERQVLELGRKLEDIGADAYLGQLGRLQREDVIDKLAAIYAVEARHAGALNELAGGRPYTPSGPYAKPLGMRQALHELDRYIL